MDEIKSSWYCDTPEPESHVNAAESPVKVAPELGVIMLAGAGGPGITSVSGRMFVNSPPVPVTLMVYVPAGHPVGILIVSNVLPVPVTDAGTEVEVAHAGTPDSVNVTVELKVLTAVTLIW